jgi:hypothetical protein
MTRHQIIKNAPPGTTGRLVLYRGCWYGVASRWHDAASPVWVLCRAGKWVLTSWRVADFKHRPKAALWWAMIEARVPYRRGSSFHA